MCKLPLEEVIALLNVRRLFISICRYETFHSGSESQSFLHPEGFCSRGARHHSVGFSLPWNSCKIGW